MIKRRLFLQIYFAIVMSLILVVVLTVALFFTFAPDGRFRGGDNKVFQITARLAQMALPPVDAPKAQQATSVKKLGADFGLNVTLFDKTGAMIGAFGKPNPAPDIEEFEDYIEDGDLHDLKGWHWNHDGGWVTRFSDGRYLVVDMAPPDRNPIAAVLLFLIAVTSAIAIGSYPLVRKLTGRLERLQSSVEQMGAGDLTARALIEGKDEVAGLATSFNEAASKIKTLVDSHKTLLANASHELRTPLSRIRLGVEMFRKTGEEKRLSALETDIAELDSLIDEILLMSRLDAGTMGTLEPEIDLLGLVAEECARFPDVTIEGNAVSLPGNARLLQRLVRNLVGNAFKHGDPPVTIKIGRNGSNAVLSVTDEGPGIAADDREKVFQRFYRAAGKQNVEGYGLGLPLVKQIAEAHGGTVHIGGGDGCEIVVTLPL